MAKASVPTPFGLRLQRLVAAMSDHGEVFGPHIARHLLDCPTSLPRDPEGDPPEELGDAVDALFWDFLGRTDRECLRLLHEAETTVGEQIRDLEARGSAFEAKLWGMIRALRAERRQDGMEVGRRDAIDRQLARLDAMTGELAAGLRARAAEMRRETEALEAAVLAGLSDAGELEVVSTVRWVARSGRRGVALSLPVFQEEPYSFHASHHRVPSAIVTETLGDGWVDSIRRRD